MSIRSGASVSQLFALNVLPRGARMTRSSVRALDKWLGSSRFMGISALARMLIVARPSPRVIRPLWNDVSDERHEFAAFDQRPDARQVRRKRTVAIPECGFAA